MKWLLSIISILLSLPCFGQGEIDSLVQLGIQYHDNGEYEKAIEVYSEALKIDSTSSLVRYELAMTYLSSGDYEKAIQHSDFVIEHEQDEDFLILACIAKGSALSDLGEVKQAINLFKEGIAKFGDFYLLHFNLGICYSKIQDNENAETAFINAIMDNTSHASSHYYLAIIKSEQHHRGASLLSLYYFLLLEPSSWRAATAYELLREQLVGNVQKNENNPDNIELWFSDPHGMEDEFLSVEMILAFIEASNLLEENKNKTPEELFISNTTSFFTALGELGVNKKGTSLWWDSYVPFFYHIAQSDYMDVFCNYISVSSNEKAIDWLGANAEKLSDFLKWVIEE